ncbi:MAG: MBL fold metallo-hydrolase [Betaproteobacteria bacterium]|nr:MBL fold metallo-hydrolase [Betaproteobacteria bacterium]
MRFASLGSGSMGNGLVFEAGKTRLLLDCGFGVKDAVGRLARIGIAPESLSGILVTHEHGDHADGVFALARRYGIPVWLSHGTLAALRDAKPDIDAGVQVTMVDPYAAFAIGDAQVQPYAVPHDAREPAQFVFSDGNRRLGVLTDTGCSTPHIEASLSGCDALVLECNHDAAMLAEGGYPPWLRARIAGRYGHLDNTTSATLLKNLDRSRLQHVIAAHLSLKNNTPDLAREALAGAMGCSPDWIGVATQESGFAWRSA